MEVASGLGSGRCRVSDLGYDVNHDGKMDLIYGQGHGYGLYWLEQAGTAQHRKWIRHTIDESFSQSHALALVDIDGDGVPELIAGKRYRGHSGADPGSYDPLVVYAYKLPTSAQVAAAKANGLQGCLRARGRCRLPMDRRPGVYADSAFRQWYGDRGYTVCVGRISTMTVI